jgi:hypothetical protein
MIRPDTTPRTWDTGPSELEDVITSTQALTVKQLRDPSNNLKAGRPRYRTPGLLGFALDAHDIYENYGW